MSLFEGGDADHHPLHRNHDVGHFQRREEKSGSPTRSSIERQRGSGCSTVNVGSTTMQCAPLALRRAWRSRHSRVLSTLPPATWSIASSYSLMAVLKRARARFMI